MTNLDNIKEIKLTPAQLTQIKEALAKQDAGKTDATYTNNRMYKVIDEIFHVNPVYNDPILQQFGSLDVSNMSPNQQWVQYEAVVAKSNGYVADDLVFSHGDSKIYPAIRKSKIFQFGVFLTELQHMALMSGGAGGNIMAAQVQAELQASKGRMQQNLLKWLIGYQTLASETDYDSLWTPMLNLKPATGTASNPEDIATAAGTATAIALNFTGTNKSKDFVLGTFGNAQEQFRAERDSVTGEQMLHRDLSGNSFLHLMNPANAYKMRQTHPYNGVQDDQNITYAGQIEALDGTHKILGSYDIDAAHDVSEDGTNIVGTILNPKENFKIGYQIPYKVGGWEKVWNGKQFGFYKRAYMKVIGWTKPYYINSTWVKAFFPWTYVYMNDV